MTKIEVLEGLATDELRCMARLERVPGVLYALKFLVENTPCPRCKGTGWVLEGEEGYEEIRHEMRKKWQKSIRCPDCQEREAADDSA